MRDKDTERELDRRVRTPTTGRRALLTFMGILAFVSFSGLLMSGATAAPGNPTMAVFSGWNVGATPRVCEADGSGGWINCQSIPIADGSPDGTSGIGSDDLNGDGFLDLAIANQNGTINTCLGSAADVWTCSSNGPTGRHHAIGIADFDNDGNLDIVSSIETTANMDLCLGDGLGGFTCTRETAPNAGRAIVVDDFTGDGNIDMVYAANGGPTSLCSNDGTASFTCSAISLPTSSDFGIALGDFDGDGNGDVANASLSDVSEVCLGDGVGGFTCSATGAGNQFLSIAAGDIDGDGDGDLIYGGNGTSSQVCLGDGLGGFTCSNVNLGATHVTFIDVGFIDGDGNLDLIVGAIAQNQSCLGDGLGGFICTQADTPSWNSQGVLLLGAGPPDGDLDGVPDGADNCPAVPNPAQLDTDGDSAGDLCDTDDDNDTLLDTEETTYGTDPLLTDTDGDTLDDAAELNTHSTNPLLTDTDGDTLDDAAELNTHGTDPLLADTDGDTLDDAAEVNTHSTNPLLADTDGDTLDDDLEIVLLGTDPSAADTDGDTLDDAAELNTHSTNPLLTDTDGDTLDDAAELNTHSTNPLLADTDGDGAPDGQELSQNTDPLVAQASQSISFADPGDLGYHQVPLAIAPTASSGLSVSVAVTGVCQLADDVLTTDQLGWCTVTASQAGDGDWFAASAVGHTFNVLAGTQTITATAPSGLVSGGQAAPMTATASSGLPVAVAATGPCTAQNLEITPTGAGTCSITVTQPGTVLWAPAADVTITAEVAKRPQEITIDNAPSSLTYGVDSPSVTATASSGLPVDLRASGDCQLTSSSIGSQLTAVRAGTCTVTAAQPGDQNWAAAPDVDMTIEVDFGQAILSFGSELYDTADDDLSPLVVVSDPPDLSGIVVRYDGELIAPIEPGAYEVTVTLDHPGYTAEPLVAQYTIADENDTTVTATAEELQTVGLPQPGDITGRLQLVVTEMEPESKAVLRDRDTELQVIAGRTGTVSLYPPRGFDLAEATLTLEQPDGGRSAVSTEDVLAVGDSTISLDFNLVINGLDVAGDQSFEDQASQDSPPEGQAESMPEPSGDGPLTVTITGSGLEAGADAVVTVRSEPVSLGTVAVTADGSFETTVTVPDSLEPGEHRILVQAENAEGTLTGTWFFAVDETLEVARVGDPEVAPDELAFVQPEPVQELQPQAGTDQPPAEEPAVDEEPIQDDAVGPAVIDEDTGLVVYEPQAEPEESIDTGVNAVALLTVVAAAGGSAAALTSIGAAGSNAVPMAAGTSGGQPMGAAGRTTGSSKSSGSNDSGSRSRGKGKIASGKAKDLGSVAEQAAWGDASSTWRWPLVSRIDHASHHWPDRLRPYSPLLSRTAADGSTLRASLGTGALLAPAAGILLAVMAVADTGGQAVAPTAGLMAALILLGIFDSGSGFLAAVVFGTGLLTSGGIDSPDDLRTLLGIGSLWFAVPLVAGGARKFRRPPADDWSGRWSKLTDVAVGPLLGAWTVHTVIRSLPGLAGLELPIAADADLMAAVALGGLLARYLSEWVHGRAYPERLAAVSGLEERTPGMSQKVASTVVKGAVMAFILTPYIGVVWQLWAVVAMSIGPAMLGHIKDRFPHSDLLFRLQPQGVPKVLVMMVIGKTAATYLAARIEDPASLMLTAFLVLSIPGFVAGMVGLFGRKGDDLNHTVGGRAAGVWVMIVAILTIRDVIPADGRLPLLLVVPAFGWWIVAAVQNARPATPSEAGSEVDIENTELPQDTEDTEETEHADAIAKLDGPRGSTQPDPVSAADGHTLAERLPDIDEVIEGLQADDDSAKHRS